MTYTVSYGTLNLTTPYRLVTITNVTVVYGPPHTTVFDDALHCQVKSLMVLRGTETKPE